MFPEPTVDDTTIKAAEFAVAGSAASSSTKRASKPNSDDWSRLRMAVSLAFGAPGVATRKIALGSALSTVKVQKLVRVSAGEPLSAKISVTRLLDKVGKSPGGS